MTALEFSAFRSIKKLCDLAGWYVNEHGMIEDIGRRFPTSPEDKLERFWRPDVNQYDQDYLPLPFDVEVDGDTVKIFALGREWKQSGDMISARWCILVSTVWELVSTGSPS